MFIHRAKFQTERNRKRSLRRYESEFNLTAVQASTPRSKFEIAFVIFEMCIVRESATTPGPLLLEMEYQLDVIVQRLPVTGNIIDTKLL